MKLVIVGKAAAGKDYLKNKLKMRDFTVGVSHTTRPPREGEVDGVDYHFIDEHKFTEMTGNDEFVEWMEFNGWFYGQTIEDFNKSDVMIMSKDGLAILPAKYRKQCVVIYLDMDRKTRIERLNMRDDVNDTIQRRLDADEEQFKDDFKDFEIRITNPNF